MNHDKLTGTKPAIRTLSLAGVDRASLLRMHRLMLLSRALGEVEIKLRRQQRTFFEIDCCGHEAVQAALSLLLKPGYDWFYPYYRDRVICLGLGVTPAEMLLQAMGKVTDPSSGGREMPNHYGSRALHIVNQSSPTGTQYLQAVGTAEAGVFARRADARLRGKTAGGPSDVTSGAAVSSGTAAASGNGVTPHFPQGLPGELTYVSGGEGSTSEGEFYEAVCLASLRKLPVLFLIQDNAYAISVPVEHQTPGGRISALMKGFPHLLVEEINGLDIVESYLGSREAVQHVRSGKGPALVHAHVVRLCPHSDSDDDRQYKTDEERSSEHRRDPIRTFESLLVQEGYLTRKDLEEIHAGVREDLAKAVQEASAAPDPEPANAGTFVFVDPPIIEVESQPRTDGPAVTMVEAINQTLQIEMARDPRIVCFGEDVADISRSQHMDTLSGKGGVFKVTRGLQRAFGDDRVFNTPIGEAGIIGRALGLAIRGLLPVPEIQFFDYIWPAMHQIRNELGMFRWRSNNAFAVPMVIRTAAGGYLTGGGPYHSQTGVSIFCHCPGLRVVMPSNARDAAGLLRGALRCGDPVLYLEHKHLYRKGWAKRPYPGPDYVVPLGKASTVRHGTDVTVVTYGALVERSLEAAQILEEDGLDIEVIDLRSLQPYDWEAIAESVRRTSRVLVAHEDSRSWGFGAEIAARIAEELFLDLDAPVARVGALDAPVGYSPVLEKAALPQVSHLVESIRSLCEF